jgi:hypothetical protein
MSFEEIYMENFRNMNEDRAEGNSMLDIYGVKRQGGALELRTETGDSAIWIGKDGKVPIIDRYLLPTRIGVEELISSQHEFVVGREDGKLYHLGFI